MTRSGAESGAQSGDAAEHRLSQSERCNSAHAQLRGFPARASSIYRVGCEQPRTSWRGREMDAAESHDESPPTQTELLPKKVVIRLCGNTLV